MNKQNEYTNWISDYFKDNSPLGQCSIATEEMQKSFPELKRVRGYYYCHIWGERQHWWMEDIDGNIIDPTASQFPSKGHGVYQEFDGLVYCEECGKEMKEDEAQWAGRFPVCGTKCHMRLVGM